MRARLALLVVAALACGNRAPPARITELGGVLEVERAGESVPAHAGTELAFGDVLRTQESSWARVRFAGGQTMRLGERAILRLGRDAASSALITLALGEAELEGAGEVSVATPRGPARLAEGSRLRIEARAAETRYEMLVGRAELGGAGDAGGTVLALGSGEGLSIAIGGAVVERYRIRVGAAELEPASPTPAVGEPDAAAPDARDAAPPSAEVAAEPDPAPAGVPVPQLSLLASASEFDLALPAGETAVVHAESTPAKVRLHLPLGCTATRARLRLQPPPPRRARPDDDSEEHLVLPLPAGTFRYRLACGGSKEVARGTLTIKRATGAATLPRTPPHNRLDADGRRYTVLYQNHLPGFTFTWPQAASPGPYTLHLRTNRNRRAQTRTVAFSGPIGHQRPGALAEGDHTWWWTAADGTRSPTTTLSIRFDNAKLSAEIQLPRPNARVPPRAAAAKLPVAGVTLLGSRVTINQTPLPLDGQGRFRAELTLAPHGTQSLAIRIEHPRTGTSYYLRRIRRD